MMKSIPRTFLLLTGILLALLPASSAAGQGQTNEPVPPPMTIWQARRVLQKGVDYHVRVTVEKIDFDLDTSHCDRKGCYYDHTDHYTVDLKTLDPVWVKCSTSGGKYHWYNCALVYKDGRPIPKDAPVSELFRSPFNQSTLAEKQNEVDNVTGWADAFAAAIDRLHEYAIDPSSPLRNITQASAAWRALAPKPPLPEAVRVQRIMAEEAVKDNKPDSALNFYESGLELLPTWPEGYFNAALIAAQLGYYADAADHMQNYLVLLPNAPDAQSARDQIAVWKYKAGQSPASAK